MNNNVICYYEPLPTLFSKESAEFIPLWEESWQKNGWSTVVLDKDFAKQHDKYSEYDIDNLDNTLYNNWPDKKYIRSCYRRTFAYCHFVNTTGSALWADYDVINYSFKPIQLQSLSNNIIIGSGTSVVKLNKSGSMSIIDNIKSFDNREGKHRFNPMLSVIKAANFTNLNGSSMFPNDIVKQYEDCRDSDFVHFHGGFCHLANEQKLGCTNRLEFAKKWRKYLIQNTIMMRQES